MKTTIRKNVLVALLLGTLICYANDNVNSAKGVKGEGIKTALVTVKEGEVFRIKNEQGVSLYINIIQNAKSLEKVFNLATLDDGIYTAELEKANEVEVKKFEVKKHLVTFLNKEKIYKPVVRTKGDLLLISKLNFGKAPLGVKIYYKGDEIFSESFADNEVILKRIYKLSASERGDYSIEFKANNRVFKEEFSI